MNIRHDRKGQLLINLFKAEIVNRRLYKVADKIEVLPAKTDPQAVAGHKQLVARLCRRFERRADRIGNSVENFRETLIGRGAGSFL